MKFTYVASDVRLNAKIELVDISQDAYDDIIKYISQRVGENPMPEMTEKDTEVLQMRAKMIEKHGDMVRRQKRVRENVQKFFDDLFLDYAKRPKAYKIQKMTAAEILDHFSEIRETTPVGLGKTIHSLKLDLHCSKEVRKSPNGNFGYYLVYDIPILQNDLGNAIKAARENDRLTIKEFADLIEYPVDVVRNWEKGICIPSTEATMRLKSALGENIF